MAPSFYSLVMMPALHMERACSTMRPKELRAVIEMFDALADDDNL